MPRKINKRKAVQAAKRKALADETARKNRKWPGTRKVAIITHHGGSMAATLAVMMAAMKMKGDDK